MPIGELESHPFLGLQKGGNNFSPENIEIIIVGTFPIYEITLSNPLHTEGVEKRNNWANVAYFKFFYGSKQNHFWKLIADAFKTDLPQSENQCINTLNKHKIFITDVFEAAIRTDYESEDSSLISTNYNKAITSYISEFPNLRKICFTSDHAKLIFCKIIGIPKLGRIQKSKLLGKELIMLTLPTPAGNARSAPHYFKDFPPTPEERLAKDCKKPYALGYRSRIYKYALTGNEKA